MIGYMHIISLNIDIAINIVYHYRHIYLINNFEIELYLYAFFA
jgi:hypothetical protein